MLLIGKKIIPYIGGMTLKTPSKLSCEQTTPKIEYPLMGRWLSGRRHVPAKDAYPYGYRGFESLSFRPI